MKMRTAIITATLAVAVILSAGTILYLSNPLDGRQLSVLWGATAVGIAFVFYVLKRLNNSILAREDNDKCK